MARMSSMTSIETKISKIESELAKLKERQDTLTNELLKLQKQKQEYETKQIMDAFKRSGKSFDELITFLNV